MLARQTNFSLLYRRCKVLVTNKTDKSYFVAYLKDIQTKTFEYCWCRANQALKLGSEVDGYLCPTEYHDSLPTLIVGECKSIIPSINRIAVMGK
jgi:hypothetical protein